jgi:chromosome segregation ATPase
MEAGEEHISKHRFLGWVLRIGGGFGFLLYILSIVCVIILRPIGVRRITTSTIQINAEIEEITSLLSVTEDALALSSEALRDTSDLMVETGDFLEDSNQLIRSVGEIVGVDAPKTIQSTQDALEAAQPGSQAVDSMLRGLSILEPITGFSYDPEKSLSQSLEEVATGLEPLPENLREVQRELTKVADELDQVYPELDVVAEDLDRFSNSTTTLSEKLNKQVDRLNAISNGIEDFSHRVATFGWISTIILCVFLALGAFSQLTVLFIGRQMFRSEEI